MRKDLFCLVSIVAAGCLALFSCDTGPKGVAFSGLTADGTSGLLTTSVLTLSFDKDPADLTADSITVTGAEKGELAGTGLTRTLAVTALSVDDGGEIAVALADTEKCLFSPASRTVAAKTMLKLVSTPQGTFQRDATAGNTSSVSAFRISEKEITRAQFVAMLGTDPSDSSFSSGDGDPVQTVNWYHAIAFCNRLSLNEGLDPVYAVSGVDFSTVRYETVPNTLNGMSMAAWDAATADWSANGYRLPTEMEWIWAAMGAPAAGRNGGVDTSGYAKSFAGSTGTNAIGDYAVFGSYQRTETGCATVRSTMPVGSKLPNELGLYDMSGNVSEWLWDWFDNDPLVGAVTDYRGGDSSMGSRLLAGGDFWGLGSACAISNTVSRDQENWGSNIGFRVVRR